MFTRALIGVPGEGLNCSGGGGSGGDGVGRTPRVPGRVPPAGPRSPRRSPGPLPRLWNVPEGRG